MAKLSVSRELQLPIGWATQTAGILAKKGAGKSNAAVVMAEELYDAGVAWVAIDPKGDWYGVRSAGSGKAPGLPIPVFGGRHGDVPLEPTAGALLADIVNEKGLTCVLDVSEFSKADQRRFLIAFGDRLYRARSDEADVVHLFLEEAHEYLPQRVMRDETQVVNTWGRIVKQGRFRGIGVTLISQRSASLNKDVLTQVDSLIVLRTTAPQDRKAVMAWVEEHDFAHELVASLPSLEDGEAWVWSPEFLRDTKRIHFRRRRTFDSGATPEVGKSRRAPATLADVDLAAIKEQMAETIEKAKAEDPKELRKRIKDLERQLAASEAAKQEPVIQRVEVPVLSQDDIKAFADVGRQVLDLADRTMGLSTLVQSGLERIDRAIERFSDRPDVPRAGRAGDRARAVANRQRHANQPQRRSVADPSSEGRASQRPDPRTRREPRGAAVPRTEEAEGLGKGELATLTAIAQTAYGVTREQLTVLTGYKRSSRNTYLQRLASRDLVDVAGERITATDAGLDALGPDFEPLPTGAALQEHWLAKLGGGEREILAVLVDAYPSSVTREDLSETTGYKRSSRNTYLQRLKARDLIVVDGELVAASGDLFDGEP